MDGARNLKVTYELDPDSVHSLFNAAVHLCNENRYDDAEPTLLRFATEFPDYDHGKPWYELAQIHEQKGRIAEAEAAYRSALLYDPNFDVYLESFAWFLWRNGKADEALKVATQLRALMDTVYVGFPADRIDRFLLALGAGGIYEDFARCGPTPTESANPKE